MSSKKSQAAQPAYAFHPLAAAFELMEGGEYRELIDDIRGQGLLKPIVLHEGMILDGRNRYRACLEAGVEPAFRPFLGDDAAAFVESANAHRRHLTLEAKRAALAKLIRLQPELSDRRIAEQTGFSHTHVAKVRGDLEETGDVATVATSTDTKGRKQPRKRKRVGKVKPTGTAEECEPRADDDPAPSQIPAISQELDTDYLDERVG